MGKPARPLNPSQASWSARFAAQKAAAKLTAASEKKPPPDFAAAAQGAGMTGLESHYT